MVPIDIDLSELVEEFALTAQQTQSLGSAIIDRIVDEYVSKWENLVDTNLGATREAYKRAMYVDRVSPTEVVFGLADDAPDGLALAIEEGKPAWDEKPSFEASSKRKETLGGGWYVTVPFRHATPEALAEVGVFASLLPKSIHKIAKENNGKPVTFGQLPDQYRQLGSRKAVQGVDGIIPEYTHKAPQYQGLVRLNIAQKDGSKGKQSGYFTFRRVSDKSDPNSWVHPGFEAKDFMGKAIDQTQVETVTSMVIDEFLESLD